MSLDSFEFLLFLPLAFALYWAIPARNNRMRNVALILLSYTFYSYADWRFSLLLLALTISTYSAGRWMFSACGGKYAKTIVRANVLLCLGVLGFFKYMGFFVLQLEAVMGGAKFLALAG